MGCISVSRRLAVWAAMIIMAWSASCFAQTVYFENFSITRLWYAQYWDPGGYIAISESNTNNEHTVYCPLSVSGPIEPGDIIQVDSVVIRGDGDSAAGIILHKPDGADVAFWIDVDGYCFVFARAPGSDMLWSVEPPTHPGGLRAGKGKHHAIKIVVGDQSADAYVDGVKVAVLGISCAGASVAVGLTVANYGATRTEARFDDLWIKHTRTTTQTPTPVVPANRAPTASFSFSPTNPQAGDSVYFSAASSTDSDGHIVRYEWDFGDAGLRPGYTVTTASHTYTRAGRFIVTLTVVDDDGARNLTTRSVTVTAPPPPNSLPVATFVFSPASPRTGEQVRFDASGSTDSDGHIVQYEWNYGDGTLSASGTPTFHTYASAGTFVVTLTVVDDDGATTTAPRSITVSSRPPATTVYSVTFSAADPAAWPTRESPQVLQGLRGGEYILQAIAQGALQLETVTPAPAVTGAPFDIEVALRSHTSGQHIAGIFFGRSADDAYYIGISPAGKIAAFRRAAGAWSAIAVTPGDPIPPPGLASVQLLVSVTAGAATIRVDGKTAGTANLPAASAAVTGLFLMSQVGPNEVGFSSFALRTP